MKIQPKKPRTAPAAVLAHVRSVAPSLHPGEAKVAAVVLREADVVVYRSVSEVADAAGTSTATVVRAAQRFGFRGFHELKLALARELAATAAETPHTFSDSERPRVIADVVDAGVRALRDTVALADGNAFGQTVRSIAAAERVLFCAVGTSGPLAQDAAYRFSAIGVRADAPSDLHVQHVRARLLEPGDVYVAISHSGSTRETLQTAEAASTAGAATVAITSFARSPLAEQVDHAIVAGTREVSFQLEAMASRLAHLALLDALLVAVARTDAARSNAAVRLYSDVLSHHRL